MPGREPSDDGGRGPKRLSADPAYRARVQVADDYGIPLSELSDWHPSDKEAPVGLRIFKGESCPDCGTHPSVWKPSLGGEMDALVAVWRHCRPCELLARARDAGPPDPETPGWRLVLEHKH